MAKFFFSNPLKEERARKVVAKPTDFEKDSVELTALNKAKAADAELKGEDLVVAVYELMGGKMLSEAEKKEVEVRVEEAKKRRKKE